MFFRSTSGSKDHNNQFYLRLSCLYGIMQEESFFSSMTIVEAEENYCSLCDIFLPGTKTAGHCQIECYLEHLIELSSNILSPRTETETHFTLCAIMGILLLSLPLGISWFLEQKHEVLSTMSIIIKFELGASGIWRN